MAKYNILSSCICRDAFGYHPESKHEVANFLQSSSPITWFHLNDKPKKNIQMEDFLNVTSLSNFQKKCIINDYNKTVLEKFEEKADFFITDLVSFAGTGLAKQIYEDGSEHYFTFSKWFNIAYTHGLGDKLEGKVESVNRFLLINQEFIKKTVSNYIEWILSKGYTADKIILVENKKVPYYSDGELLYYFEQNNSRDTVNGILDQIYSEFERQLPNCYVIKMPADVYADTRHIWGLTDLHFCKEYYDYLYECFDMISVCSNCQNDIFRLREQYSNMFQKQKDIFVRNSFECMSGKQLLNGAFINEKKSRIIKKDALYFENYECKQVVGRLSRYLNAFEVDKGVVQFTIGTNTYYAKADDCVTGFVGDNQKINDNWRTVNLSTLVVIQDESIIVGHNGCDSAAQTQIISTLDRARELADKVITISVFARVLQSNDQEQGGTLDIINANGYNKGKFYRKIDFNNKKWQRVSLTVRLPREEELQGITICLRALAGSGKNSKHSLVEFSDPKVEMGSFCTNH